MAIRATANTQLMAIAIVSMTETNQIVVSILDFLWRAATAMRQPAGTMIAPQIRRGNAGENHLWLSLEISYCDCRL